MILKDRTNNSDAATNPNENAEITLRAVQLECGQVAKTYPFERGVNRAMQVNLTPIILGSYSLITAFTMTDAANFEHRMLMISNPCSKNGDMWEWGLEGAQQID